MNYSKLFCFYNLYLILFFIFFNSKLKAQTDSIAGIILDDFGIEIPFVRVIGIDSLNQLVNGDISDLDGEFSIAKSKVKRIVFISDCTKDTFDINQKMDYIRIKGCNDQHRMTTSATCPYFSSMCDVYRIVYLYPSQDNLTDKSTLTYRIIYKTINQKEPQYTWKCLTHGTEY
jgi:hypothetical protein